MDECRRHTSSYEGAGTAEKTGRENKLELGSTSANEAFDLPTNLLNDIHYSMLRFYKLKDIIKMAALSRAWRHCWRSLANLNFAVEGMLDRILLDSCAMNLQELKQIREDRVSELMKFADTFLQNFDFTQLETFTVRFPYEGEKHHLDQWIRSAISSGVKEMRIEFDDIREGKTFYQFPLDMLASRGDSSLINLYLYGCVLSPSPDFRGFMFLKKLELYSVSMVEAAFQNLLPECYSLEWLHLRCCEWLVHLIISNPSSKLRYLQVTDCSKVKEVTISAANLECLEYDGEEARFTLKNAPKLVRALIYPSTQGFCGIDHITTRFSNDMPQLKTLFLHFYGVIEAGCLTSNLNIFINLKHLVVTTHSPYGQQLLWLSLLLDAAPFLEKLHLCLNSHRIRRMPSIDAVEERGRPTGRIHNYLKEVMIGGFSGFVNELEFVRSIFQYAVALKLVIIDPFRMLYQGDYKWARMPPFAKEMLPIQKATELLSEVPSGAKLVIL